MFYVLGIASMLLQAICAMHAYQNGRQNWIWWIVIGGPLGVCAYFSFMIMPELAGPRAVKAQIKKAQDPALRLQKAEAALAEVETAANHNDVADAMFDMRAFDGAAEHYRLALDCLRGPDARIEKKLAEALFESGDAAGALAIIERQPIPMAVGEADRLSLLKGRVLEYLSQDDDALALYRDVATRLPGEEARCRLAALLLKRGARDDALGVLEEVGRNLHRNGHARAGDEAAMHQWAMAQLKELRER